MGYLAYNNQATFYHVQKFFEFRNKETEISDSIVD